MILSFYHPFVYLIGWIVICCSIIFIFGVLPLWYLGRYNAEQRKTNGEAIASKEAK